ncbi:MAG TPA: shikimate kinase [Actinobacteria bacterium]|nr:shikimate kinase [Actinomycetota bacterium]
MPSEGHCWLVGMMGVGKSTVGRRLATMAGRPFVDLDALVAAEAGCAIDEIFAREGEEGFRSRERRLLARVAAGPPGVVATGGGAVLDDANVAAMRRSGLVVLLEATIPTLVARVGGGGRPLLEGTDPRVRLTELAAARRARYEAAADLVVDTEGREVATIAEEILERWIGS